MINLKKEIFLDKTRTAFFLGQRVLSFAGESSREGQHPFASAIARSGSENRQMYQELHAHRNDKKHQVRRPLATEICGRGPHCPISTPRVQQRGSRMVAAVATGAICSLHHWAAACVTDGDPDGSGAPCVPSRPRRSTHARPRDTHGAPRGGRRGRRRVRTIVVEDTERPPRVLIRVRHKLSETPKLCCARLIDRSCRAHANRVCVA